jgi:hypothetical protein
LLALTELISTAIYTVLDLILYPQLTSQSTAGPGSAGVSKAWKP